jgi:hypothetical protein
LAHLDNFEELGLGHDQFQSCPHPFCGVVLGKQSIPLGWVTVPATFRDESNYRTETLVFEVVNFFGSFHVILGWPCYVKFMAITSYAYLKLQILGPTGVITVEAKAQRALDCEQKSLGLAAAVELREFSPQEPTKPLTLVMPQCLAFSRWMKMPRPRELMRGT